MTPDIAHPTSGGQEHLQWPLSQAASQDYAHDHPREHPSDWGWHGEWGRWARVAGWVCVIILLLMITATHYNGAGAVGLIATAALLVIALVWDIQRRRTAWRK